ncbi:tyrosine-type recombinase/integrase [Enterovirga aerilata]|uniref:Tyrosine-type recombinase/integrase n=1 Tax=Enterovirga aerilata TaxID=2730920 RepID=A0A849HZA5_9HYPH|nr:tyrosine-type recombinase/integrase [Enterovirga sp. DB1703]NNM72432.1 tyrosine-type recombinase/integrase [Enterovirga sp. DB1703]
MARAKASELAIKAKRLAWAVSKKPRFESLGDGISLGYRRNQGAGTWIARKSDGRGGSRQERVGLADDYQAADGEHVMTFAQAQARALSVAAAPGRSRSVTLGAALQGYEADLRIRNADVANVARLRGHLSPELLDMPIAKLTARDLSRWRDELAGKRQPSTVNRVSTALKAALNFMAGREQGLANAEEWDRGLKALPDASVPRNVVVPDNVIRKIVDASYRVSEPFGLLVEVAEITGARYSQIAGLRVQDLQGDTTAPRLMMPSAKKGRGVKKVRHRPVPIASSLARRLAAHASGREGEEPLLLKHARSSWRRSDHTRLFARAIRFAELTDEDVRPIKLEDVTMYALRHSSITRQLLRGTPVRVVAVHHDTSVQMIERNYSAMLADHADAIARSALLDMGEADHLPNQ